MRCLSLWFLMSGLAPADDDPPSPEALGRAAELREATELPDPTERRAAVERLAKAEPSVDAWLDAIAAFGGWEARKAGPSMFQAPLFTGEQVEAVSVEVFVPTGYDQNTPTMLLMQLHAAGGSAAGAHSQWRHVANEVGMLVVSPSSASDEIGYGFTENERVTALSTLRWVFLNYHVDPQRVIVSGISRGGHMAWDLGLRYPDRFSAMAPMIGGPRFSTRAGQNNIRYLEHLVSMPIRDLQGALDDPGLTVNLRMAFAQLKKWKAADAQYHVFDQLAHNFRFEAVDWAEFLRSVHADANPDQVVRWAAEPGERSHWLECGEVDDKKVSLDFGMNVSAARWNGMNEEQKRKVVYEESIEHSGRLEGRRTEVGKFTLKAERVKSARLWLDRESFEAGKKLQVQWRGRRKRLEVEENATVLLGEFVERLNPAFLPVATVEVR